MHKSFLIVCKKITIIRIIVPLIFIGGLVLPFFTPASASEREASVKPALPTRVYSEDETRLTALQKEARNYRKQGAEYQQMGELDTAMSYYQKAVELDPGYAVAYNDLGIIYEVKGMPERAERNYLKAIKINPNFFSAYSNLALCYENQRDLQKAAEYWQKRIDFGPAADPWIEKAKRRLDDIRLVLAGKSVNLNEDNILSLMNNVLVQKTSLKTDDKALARTHFEKAKRSYKKGDTVTAIKEAGDAKALDPSNREIDEFLDRVQIRALLR